MIKERKIESIRFETKAVIYQNETGFKILAGVAYNADSGEMLRKCSLKGQLSDVEDGDTLFVSGDWDEHPKYGVGFRAEAYVKAVPHDKKSMLAYLKHGESAGYVGGIGILAVGLSIFGIQAGSKGLKERERTLLAELELHVIF